MIIWNGKSGGVWIIGVSQDDGAKKRHTSGLIPASHHSPNIIHVGSGVIKCREVPSSLVFL
jgi:hypothetical protein